MNALRVMIIEDEALIAILFEDVLTEMGHEVCASERTQAGAISAALHCHPQLIIADIRLQNGSGVDAVNAIIKDHFIPHVFVSGDVLRRERFNPAAGILQKPFDEGQLVFAIERAIDPATILIGQNHQSLCLQA